MKLIFCHIFKTGGESFRNWLDSRLNIFDSRTESIQSEEALWKRICEADVIIQHSKIPLQITLDRWNQLLSQSIRLSIVRNPIARFESNWQHAVNNSIKFALPYAPSFLKLTDEGFRASITNNSLQMSDLLGGYFDQKKSEQITMEDFFQIYYEFHTGNSQFKETILSPTLSSNQISFGDSLAGIFHGKVINNQNYHYSNFFEKDSQSYMIDRNLGADFIRSPRTIDSDILMVTERLAETFASMILKFSHIKAFTKFRDFTGTRDQLIQLLDDESRNITPSEYSANPEYRLSPKDRIRFFLVNQNDFKLWQFAYTNSFIGYTY